MRRFKFKRNDSQDTVIIDKNPMAAWEQLCESFDDDYFFIKRFMDSKTNTLSVYKGYKWLNTIIDRNFDGNFGPVYFEL